MPKITVDNMLLEAALIGLEQKREGIIQAMARLKSSVDGNAPRAAVPSAPTKRARMTAAARKRLSLAMKRRWSAARKAGKKRLT